MHVWQGIGRSATEIDTRIREVYRDYFKCSTDCVGEWCTRRRVTDVGDEDDRE